MGQYLASLCLVMVHSQPAHTLKQLVRMKCRFPITSSFHSFVYKHCRCNSSQSNCKMLSLAPLSGLQAAIKRRNSKLARRDSISIEHSNLALPGTIRRFSSTEALNSQSSAPSVATVSRISSFSRKIRKISTGNSPAQTQTELVDSCNDLDLHIAQIKRKLVSVVCFCLLPGTRYTGWWYPNSMWRQVGGC